MGKITTQFLLRIALSFSFIYAGISGFMHPENWVGWLPAFVRNLSPFNEVLTLHVFSVLQIIIALWLLSGWLIFFVAIISGLLLIGIIIFNLGAMDIVFRDISLAVVAFALVISVYKEGKR